MRFEQLIARVQQAERALEAHTRRTAADWRQLRSAWRALWTPWRIVLAGFAAGFVAGRSRPSPAAMDGLMRLLTTLAGLFAGTQAQAAAAEAEQAAQHADTAATHAPPADTPAPATESTQA